MTEKVGETSPVLAVDLPYVTSIFEPTVLQLEVLEAPNTLPERIPSASA